MTLRHRVSWEMRLILLLYYALYVAWMGTLLTLLSLCWELRSRSPRRSRWLTDGLGMSAMYAPSRA